MTVLFRRCWVYGSKQEGTYIVMISKLIKKHIGRIGTLLLASVLLAVLLEFLQIHNQPPAYENNLQVVQEADLLDFHRQS